MEIPESVKKTIDETRSFGDADFADIEEKVVKYYLKTCDSTEWDPTMITDLLEELLKNVNEVLNVEEE